MKTYKYPFSMNSVFLPVSGNDLNFRDSALAIETLALFAVRFSSASGTLYFI